MTAPATCQARDALQHMRALPFAPLDAIAPGTSLILAPHPDDESLGCGGLIAAACAQGRPPLVVCVSDGAASHPESVLFPPERLAAIRQTELRNACAQLGLAAAHVHALGLPDTRVPTQGPSFDAAVARIAALARAQGVTTMFASWQHDPHADHAATARLAEAAARAAGTQLLFYPVWGWLLPDDHPLPASAIRGARLAIGAHLAAKRRAIAAHASQYTAMITDSPNGFRLPPALLSVFDEPYEVFLAP
jgi:LmbE family N-acetylglucosaminyl deacetylase